MMDVPGQGAYDIGVNREDFPEEVMFGLWSEAWEKHGEN